MKMISSFFLLIGFTFLAVLIFLSPQSGAEFMSAIVDADGTINSEASANLDAELLAQESDPNYIPPDDDFLVEIAEELEASVNSIGDSLDTVKVKTIPMTEFEQSIVNQEIDENKLHLTALSDKLTEEMQANAKLAEELEECQGMVQDYNVKLTEMKKIVDDNASCSPEKESQLQQQIKTQDETIAKMQQDMLIEQEKVRFVERNAQQVDIKLKLAKNELNVAKIALEQQKLSMDSTIMQFEEQINNLQKEIHRVNQQLTESRRALKTAKVITAPVSQLTSYHLNPSTKHCLCFCT